MAKTIDNLGLDTSNRYAEDRELFDESYIKDARSVTSQISINTTAPSHPEFDLLFDLGKRQASWASFNAPINYYASRRHIFAQQVIPQLGSPDKQEAQISRIEAVGDDAKKKQPQSTARQQIEDERKILLKLLGNIHDFDLLLIDINSRRAQYQKG